MRSHSDAISHWEFRESGFCQAISALRSQNEIASSQTALLAMTPVTDIDDEGGDLDVD